MRDEGKGGEGELELGMDAAESCTGRRQGPFRRPRVDTQILFEVVSPELSAVSPPIFLLTRSIQIFPLFGSILHGRQERP